MTSNFTPKYDQPVTLAELSTIEPELLVNEISRLENSLKHLKRSNEELREYLNDDDLADDPGTKEEFVNIVFENQETISKQEERIEMVRLALQEQIGVQATNSHYTVAADPNPPPPPRREEVGRDEGEEEEVTGMASAVRRTRLNDERVIETESNGVNGSTVVSGEELNNNDTHHVVEEHVEGSNGMYL